MSNAYCEIHKPVGLYIPAMKIQLKNIVYYLTDALEGWTVNGRPVQL